MITTEKQVFQTRWGFVPCSYDLYKKIKRLNFLYCENLKVFGAHRRYFRKDHKNRVKYKIRRNEKGQKIGKVKIGYLPYPHFCEVFTRGNIYEERASIKDMSIRMCYERARRPVATEKQVPRLPMTEEQIEKMLKAADEWYGNYRKNE